MTPPTILLFLKAPRPGLVKTRLAKTLGEQKATNVYRELVEITLSKIPKNWPTRVHFAPADTCLLMEKWLGSHLTYIPQPNGDLGHRLQTACEQAFNDGAKGVILLGGDCPGLTSAHLEECEESLLQNKPVIGPAEDGGYWLLGLPTPQPELFCDIQWSTPEVLPITLDRFTQSNQTPVLLETLFDVDEQETYEKATSTGLLSKLADQTATE